MSAIAAVAQDLLELDEEELTTKLGLLDRDLNAGVRGATSRNYLENLPERRVHDPPCSSNFKGGLISERENFLITVLHGVNLDFLWSAAALIQDRRG